MISFNNSWDEHLQGEFSKQYYKRLRAFLYNEYKNGTVFPDMNDIYAAFKATPYHKVKVVILGQDPYHEPGQAHGMSFSVRRGVPIPPSLRNIFKEIQAEVGGPIPSHGCLEGWAAQGVLLLNAVLTVRSGVADSHRNKGWEIFTDAAVAALSARECPLVFMLWGKNAAQKLPLIDQARHLVLTCPHPSPLSAARGFFGCGHFSAANEFLIKNIMTPVDWVVAH